MSRVGLKQLIGRQDDTRALISTIAAALGEPVAIADRDGKLLHGHAVHENGDRYPVTLAGKELGWVSGARGARTIATLIDHLLTKEAERKALGTEVLHLYREVNLIYSFAEKLAALLDLDRVARLTLQEARHVIVATDGVIMLLDGEPGVLSPVASFGDALASLTGVRCGDGIIGSIASTGIAEIVDDVANDARGSLEDVRSLICAPLKVGERVIGLIALASTVPLVYTAAELKLLSTLALQTATAIENARLFERTVQAARERERLLAAHKEVEIARAKLESELILAARIQADLFPAELPRVAGYGLAARNRPARRCGGDYYDALTIPPLEPTSVEDAGVRRDAADSNRLLLCVADVSGKGLPAALVMSNMQATLRALLGRTRSLPDLAALSSELLLGATSADKYVTAALLELMTDTGAVRYVSAGHVPTLLVSADGHTALLESTGLPLGLLSLPIPYGERLLVLSSGDSVVMYSDGVPDAQRESGEEFGEARLMEIVRASRHRPAEAIVAEVFEAIDEFVGDAPQFDDITLMVLRKL